MKIEKKRRVVITGLGTVNPTGNTVAESWAAVKAGRCAVGPITAFDTTDFKVKLAAEVKDFDPAERIDRREARKMARFTQFAVAAADEAIHDSGIEGIANQKSSDMDNRLAIFNERSNAVCISIHQNQFTDPKYSGAQMFYAPTNKDSERLAQKLQGSFHTRLQPDNDREIKQCGKELFLCYFSKNPTVMVECGFLSNPQEAARLSDPAYQRAVAFTLYEGLLRNRAAE